MLCTPFSRFVSQTNSFLCSANKEVVFLKLLPFQVFRFSKLNCFLPPPSNKRQKAQKKTTASADWISSVNSIYLSITKNIKRRAILHVYMYTSLANQNSRLGWQMLIGLLHKKRIQSLFFTYLMCAVDMTIIFLFFHWYTLKVVPISRFQIILQCVKTDDLLSHFLGAAFYTIHSA
ncbi:hypothetical protein EGR_05470 [Echinococcus granulosus]|uniref:Uncharacterized protein n=1 Tax=Echinococcus granulosus TaxID=6210 RepID=W6UF21_ECHGR|nr:hypothetical protein EGR_05470 [Echinococcus granulosus]EUB59708.1 hypothetical protein EGR_05470 [Echinococcus granulosus]